MLYGSYEKIEVEVFVYLSADILLLQKMVNQFFYQLLFRNSIYLVAQHFLFKKS